MSFDLIFSLRKGSVKKSQNYGIRKLKRIKLVYL